MKKYLITGLTIATLIGGGIMASATTNEEVTTPVVEELTMERDNIQENEVLSKVAEIKNTIGNDENIYLTKEDYKGMVEELLAEIPVLVKENEPQIGDVPDQLLLQLELQEANKQVEDLQDYLDNLREYQEPMSAEELNLLLGE